MPASSQSLGLEVSAATPGRHPREQPGAEPCPSQLTAGLQPQMPLRTGEPQGHAQHCTLGHAAPAAEGNTCPISQLHVQLGDVHTHQALARHAHGAARSTSAVPDARQLQGRSGTRWPLQRNSFWFATQRHTQQIFMPKHSSASDPSLW